MNAEALPLTITEVDREAPAPSPFLPGTSLQYAWDSTCLGYLKQCPRLYQLIIIEGWAPKDESIHIAFGSEFHRALEDYDRLRAEGLGPHASLQAVVGDLLTRTVGWVYDPETKAGRYKNRDTLLSLVIDYLDKYKDDPAVTFILEDGRPAVELSFRFELDWGPTASSTLIMDSEVIQPYILCGHLDRVVRFADSLFVMDRKTFILEEGRPSVELSFRFELDWGPQRRDVYKGPSFGDDSTTLEQCQPYILCGHLDRVVRFADSLFVMDRKTSASTLGSYFFDNFEPNNQMTLYTLASQVILGSPVKGVVVDAAQIMLEEPNRFVRGTTYRTPDQLEEWIADLAYWLRQAEGYAEARYWPQNDTACGMYGGCRFREVCSKSPHVRERFLESQFVKKPEEERWNPLSVRG